MSSLASERSSSAPRCCVLPTAMVPRLSLPGCARAALSRLGHRLVGRIRAGREHQLEIAERGDRGEVLHQVEGKLLVDRLADRGAVGDEAERIAVGRGGDHRARRGDAAGARHVLDHEALAELLAELVGGEPRGRVGDAAGSERQDHPHRPAGIGLRARHMRHAERGGRGQRRSRERPARDPGLPAHHRLLTNSLTCTLQRTQLAFFTLRPSRCASTWSTCITSTYLWCMSNRLTLCESRLRSKQHSSTSTTW